MTNIDYDQLSGPLYGVELNVMNSEYLLYKDIDNYWIVQHIESKKIYSSKNLKLRY